MSVGQTSSLKFKIYNFKLLKRGYPLENRSYQSDDIDYKFTGKQRDTETGYDYFGARYYDARIGRWGGVEPLLEKYISYSPYQYGLLNPMRLVDADGMDVYIKGTDAVNTVIAINESAQGDFFVSIDPSTGKLSCEGTPITDQELLLETAILYDKVNVELNTVDKNYYEDGTPFVVGGYYGSEVDNNGVINTLQEFNISHAKVWEKAGGSNVGLSAIHEILESYMGGIIYPKQGSKYDDAIYKKIHEIILSFENPKQYNPKPLHYYEEIRKQVYLHNKTTLYNENTDQEYLLFENEFKK